MNIENIINNKDFFNPNNFTKEKNPVLAALYKNLIIQTDWGRLSDSMVSLQDKHSEKCDIFFESLHGNQHSKFDDFAWSEIEKSAAEQTESFIRGFKLAFALFGECMK